MNIDKKVLAYSFLQFNHSKKLRDQWRIKLPALHLLATLIYSEEYMKPPKRGGIKTRLFTLNPQLNYYRMGLYLDSLESVGLIRYKSGNNLQTYTIESTKEGQLLIEELFSVPIIGELVRK